jgi:hypothetical protein
MSEHEVLKFNLDLDSIPVELESPETGKVQKYVLKEMTGNARDQYISFIGKRMKTDEDGKQIVSSFEGLQANLLHSCLFKVDDNGKESTVPIGSIQKWPSRVVESLFKAAKDLSALDDEAEEEAGND